MTAMIRHDKKDALFFKPFCISLIALAPLPVTVLLVRNGQISPHSALPLTGIVLFITSVNFCLAIMMEPYRRHFSKHTTPALMSEVGIALLFAMTEAVSSFFGTGNNNYGFITPLLVISLAMVCGAVFTEKSIVMKGYLGLNSAVLALLWALGAADVFSMPF